MISQCPAHLKHPKYRSDIDGLRAIAVLSVVGFHAFPGKIAGGFLGVDIFFVISGFLISSIIFSNLEHDSFSLVEFYARRVKRIFPALLIVLIASFAFGWVVLLAEEYKQLGKHLIGSAGFVSNIILYKENGYFDAAAETKPLLHLWSLAIEEQFYIFWPLLLAFVWKKKWSFIAITAIVATFSFAANVYQINKNPAAAFYFPVTRFWELMFGGLLAYIAMHKQHWNSQLKNVQSIFGFVLLTLGLTLLNKGRAFPGWWALLPTLGAFFVISAGPTAWLNRCVLSNKCFVWVGLISYPLYLWHWPLLSFARILAGTTPSLEIQIWAVIISVFLAWLTLLIERPIRFGKHNRATATPLLILMVFVGYAGYKLHCRDGLASRPVVNAKANKMFTSGFDGWDEGKSSVNDCGIVNDEDKKLFGSCTQDSRGIPRYALLGDSKAGAMYGGLVRTSSEKGRWLFIGNNAPHDPPIPVLSDNKIYERYQKLTKIAISSIIQNKSIEVVVLVVSTRKLFNLANDYSIEDLPVSRNFEAALDGLNNVVKIFVENGKKIVIVSDNPTLPDPKECIHRTTDFEYINNMFENKTNPRCSIEMNRHLDLSSQYRNLLLAVERENAGKVTLFDTTKYMCDVNVGVCLPYKDGRLLYSYTDHISDYAAGLIGKDLNDYLNNDFLKSALLQDALPHNGNSQDTSHL